MAVERLAVVRTKAAIVERSVLRREQVGPLETLLASLLAIELRGARDALGATFAAAAFDAWIEAFYPAHEERMAGELAGPLLSYGGAIAETALSEIGSDASPPLDSFAPGYTAAAASRWTRSSIAQLRSIVKTRADPGVAIAERLDDWSKFRAGHVAQEEATRGAGAFAVLAYLAGGRTRMRWRSLGESCPLCQRMNGRIVTIGEPFVPEGGKVEASGKDGPIVLETRSSIGHPPLHGAGKGGVCDCILEAA